MRVRFAPSPTGFLHLGGLRTALFNFLLSRKVPNLEGKFILRIEDTDRSRFVPSAIEHLQKTLKWAGITYDEGPDKPGKFGPYIQSQRLSIYKAHSDLLIDNHKAYRCFCSKERLDIVKGINGRYDGHCRTISRSESNLRASNNECFTIRFDTQELLRSRNDFGVRDEVYGFLKWNQLDDVILMKSDGFPTYHFANVVDDYLMKISLVMRGAEWLPSTPLHALLYEAFEWPKPRFVHLPLLINPDGSKLSKRQDSAHVSHYIKSGFLPSALNNFVAFLGWTPDKLATDVLGMDELVQEFCISRLNTSDSTVNLEKLKWLNRQHLKRDASVLISQLRDLINESFASDPSIRCDDEYLKQVLELCSERIFFLHEIVTLCSYFFRDPVYNASFGNKDLEKMISAENDYLSLPFPLLRHIMTGCKIGPSIQETMKVLGEETCKRRFENYKQHLLSIDRSNLALVENDAGG